MPSVRCAKIGCRMHELLRKAQVEENEAAILERARTSRQYERGDVIFAQGTISSELFCLRGGQALLWHEDAFQHRTGFRVAGPCEIIGFRSFFAEDVHAATAQAVTGCNVCVHPRAAVERVIEHNPKFAREFLRTLARDRGPADALLLRGQHLSVKVRLICLLLILKDHYGRVEPDNSLTMELPIMRRDIASLLGARAESVTRAIKDLQHDGIVQFQRRLVTAPDVVRLYREAQIET